ncbi:MAG TPA: hypothetical protein VLT36_08035 [Candidatus Dormibacteraeota bacterium]|nr:hypothetical protein [Candidatus Dormibacteraeota bacterium]
MNLTTKAGQERYFTVSADGTLTAVEVGLEETPPEVQKTIKAQVGAGKLENIEKTIEDKDISYEVDMTTKAGQERSFTVGIDGKLTMAQIGLEEVPTAAKKTFEEHLGNQKFGDIYRMYDGANISYDAEVHQGDKTRDIVVSADGKLESIQVFLGELPTAAQKTIQEKLGSGQIIRIDKSTEKRGGVEPFEVEARKDGKPFNFSVGPRGRFLGVDQ